MRLIHTIHLGHIKYTKSVIKCRSRRIYNTLAKIEQQQKQTGVDKTLTRN